LVVGEKERQAGAVAVRSRGGLDLGVMPLEQFTSLLKEDVALRRNTGLPAPQVA
jgi:threonyl-tRNA synthetase